MHQVGAHSLSIPIMSQPHLQVLEHRGVVTLGEDAFVVIIGCRLRHGLLPVSPGQLGK